MSTISFVRPLVAKPGVGSISRRIEFKTDDDGGPWISGLKTGSVRIDCERNAFFNVYVFDTQLGVFATWSPSVFRVEVNERVPDTVREYHCVHETYPIEITLRIEIFPTTLGFKLVSVRNTSNRFAIHYVEFPKFRMRPFAHPDNLYAVMPWTTGFVYKAPHSQQMACGMPNEMQWTCMFDGVTGQTVMFRFDDLSFQHKLWFCYGDGTTAEHNFRHLCDKRFETGYSWSRDNYWLHVELFDPPVRSAALAPYAAARKYREWIEANPPQWLRNGRWPSNPQTSSVAKAMDAHISYTGGYNLGLYQTALTRLQTHCAFAQPVATVYTMAQESIDAGEGTVYPDPGTVAAAFLTLLTAVQSAGWKVITYTIVRIWSRQITTSSYKLTSYSGLDGTIPADLTPYCHKNRAGTTRQVTDTGILVSLVDWFHKTVWNKVLRDLARRLLALFTSPTINGVYFDNNGSFVAASDYGIDTAGDDASEQNDDPADSTWTHKAMIEGHQESLQAYRSALRASDPTMLLCSEWPQEVDLPHLDFTFHNDMHPNIGMWMALFHVVYGEYTRFSAFATPQISGNDISQNLANIQAITVSWLRSGVVTLNDAIGNYEADPVLVHSPATDSPLYYMIEWMRQLRIAFASYSDSFQGHLTMPVVDTWQSAAVLSNDSPSGWHYWIYSRGDDYLIFSESWQKANKDLDILVAYAYPTLAVALQSTQYPPEILTVLFNVFPAQTVTIAVDTTIDDLVAGTKQLWKNELGVRTLLATFTDSVTVDVTINPWTVTRFEVRAA